MDEENKLPLKRVELSLTKFNEVAIPHHLDLLRQHKANIIKYEERGELTRARAEQSHARRVAAQLRALLGELEALRARVRSEERAAFDQRTQRSRERTLRAIVDYLETTPLSINRRAGEAAPAAVSGSAVSTESVGVVRDQTPDAVEPLELAPQLQLQVDDHEARLREREALLRGWSELQGEVRALHEVWQRTQAAALAQRELAGAAAARVEHAAADVSVARAHLSAAERLGQGALGVGGACVGALLGGPVGLCAGAKAGALAAAAGSLLGYVGARLWRPRAAPAPAPLDTRDEHKQK